MAVIKRYPNRKLYHLDNKQYITLEQIAELIRNGETVQVVEHSSGEDVTTRTLSQIILEQEKRNTGMVSLVLLEKLIRAGRDEEKINEIQIIFSTYINQLIDHEITRRVEFLAQNKQLSKTDAQNLAQKLISLKTRDLEDHWDQTPAILLTYEELETYLDQYGVPSQNDLQVLDGQLHDLFHKLESLSVPVREI